MWIWVSLDWGILLINLTEISKQEASGGRYFSRSGTPLGKAILSTTGLFSQCLLSLGMATVVQRGEWSHCGLLAKERVEKPNGPSHEISGTKETERMASITAEKAWEPPSTFPLFIRMKNGSGELFHLDVFLWNLWQHYACHLTIATTSCFYAVILSALYLLLFLLASAVLGLMSEY